MVEKHLTLPLSNEEVKSLKTGEVVYLTGELVQILGPAHIRAMQYRKEGKELPFSIDHKAIYHCYTCLSETDGGLRCHFLGASTSAGVNPYEPGFIREFGIQVIIGKGGMDQKTLDAMQEVGCVYLGQIGGCSRLCSMCVEEVVGRYWEDLAANVVVKMKVKEFGPLIVGMDANGNSFYDAVKVEIEKNREKVFARIDSE